MLLGDSPAYDVWAQEIASGETMGSRAADLVRQGKGKDEVSKLLVNDYGWPAGGLAIQQVDGLIAELKP